MNTKDMREDIRLEAERNAAEHFRDGRDEYEKLAAEVIEGLKNPKYGMTPEQWVGPFLRGIAKNNYYYGYAEAKHPGFSGWTQKAKE